MPISPAARRRQRCTPVPPSLREDVCLLLGLPGGIADLRLLAWLGRRRRSVLAGSDELIVSFFIKGGNVYRCRGAFLGEIAS